MSTSTNSKVLLFTDGDNITLHVDAQAPDCFESRDVDIKLYFNGVEVPELINYSKSVHGSISGDYKICNATLHSQGIYEAVLVWKYKYKCPDYYKQLRFNNDYNNYYNYFELEDITLRKSYMDVTYYGNVSHLETSD